MKRFSRRSKHFTLGLIIHSHHIYTGGKLHVKPQLPCGRLTGARQPVCALHHLLFYSILFYSLLFNAIRLPIHLSMSTQTETRTRWTCRTASCRALKRRPLVWVQQISRWLGVDTPAEHLQTCAALLTKAATSKYVCGSVFVFFLFIFFSSFQELKKRRHADMVLIHILSNVTKDKRKAWEVRCRNLMFRTL